MYITIMVFFSLIIIIGAIILIGGIASSEGEMINVGLVVTILFGLFLWGQIELATYTVGEPTVVDKTEISVMYDEDVCIIRYEGYQKTYDKKKTYDAIISGEYELEKTMNYNIQGESLTMDYTVNVFE